MRGDVYVLGISVVSKIVLRTINAGVLANEANILFIHDRLSRRSLKELG